MVTLKRLFQHFKRFPGLLGVCYDQVVIDRSGLLRLVLPVEAGLESKDTPGWIAFVCIAVAF
jgi:hypothetical protein